MNRRTIASFAIAALAFGPTAAFADATGMSGVVVDPSTLAPVEGATVVVTRVEAAPQESKELMTDRHGFFADIALEPGTYLVSTNARGQTVTCIVDNVPYGVVRNMRIVLGSAVSTAQCRGALVQFGLVDPDQHASLYPV